jgi:hypothetical protein
VSTDHREVAGTTPPASSLDSSAGRLWRAARGPVVVGLLVLAVAVGMAVLRSGAHTGALDPRAVDQVGSKALAELLRDRGVRIELAETTEAAVRAAAGGEATVLVTVPALLADAQLDELNATGADLVLVAPDDVTLEQLGAGITFDDVVEPAERAPSCDLPAATRAGALTIGGPAYAAAPSAGGEAFVCYGGDAGPLASVTADGRTVTALGAADLLTNADLADGGNAALALGLLGGSETLVWYLPSLTDVQAGGQESFYDLVPEQVGYTLAVLAIGVVLLALWRMRRLGPVVAEPLPVVVRATETVRGRARLYRRSGARDTAAEMLRRASRQRLAHRSGLPRAAGGEALVEAVAARAGRSPGEVAALLYGAAPADDAALVRLAEALDALEREVRRS